MTPLTERQAQIADAVAEGLTEAEIGERLGLSRYTVRNHKQAIFNKTGARNSVELTRIVTADLSRATDNVRGNR